MDRREQKHQWYSDFDERHMTVTVIDNNGNDVEVPVIYDVCGTCDGRGTHVNPSIDSQGLSREDFDDDPDFEHDYLRGRYDMPCVECAGRRVVPVVSDAAPQLLKDLVAQIIRDHYAYQAELDAERRMEY